MHLLCSSGFLFLSLLAVFLVLIHRHLNVAIIKVWLATWLYNLLLPLSGDVEINPGHKSISSNAFSIYHGNLNRISAHNNAKAFFHKACIAIHQFDIVYISKTNFDPIAPSDGKNLKFPWCNLIRSDRPSNNIWGGVFICWKTALPQGIRIANYLPECIDFELKICGKIYIFLTPCSPLNQTLKLLLKNLAWI